MISLPVIRSVEDVAEYQLCCGCGACAFVSPDRLEMVDVLDFGRRPHRIGAAAPRSEEMSVCVGRRLELTFDRSDPGLVRELSDGWGPVRRLWEGHATDPEVRFRGSSGGAATALALFSLERGGMHGVLHITAREDIPYLNRTVLSTTRENVLAAAGSRYAPASPCDGLGMVEEAPGPCVVIGKPCDIAAANRAGALRPKLREKLGLTIAFFCAGTPTTRGTLEMLRAMGVDDPDTIKGVRYRGNGWPGRARAEWERDGVERAAEMSYEESWGRILQKHRQWRCYVCPDHTGEAADIAVGDPWYRPITEGEAGYSLVVARTPRGLRFVEEAIAAGYLALEERPAATLPASQPNLLAGRGAVWGRVLGLRLMNAPRPIYRGIPMAHFWWSELGLKEKIQSIAGTIKRVFRKRLRVRATLKPYQRAASLVEVER